MRLKCERETYLSGAFMLANYCDTDRDGDFDDTMGSNLEGGLESCSQWDIVTDLQRQSGCRPSNERSRSVVLGG